MKETTLNKYLYCIRYFFDFLIAEALVKQKTNPLPRNYTSRAISTPKGRLSRKRSSSK